MAKQEDREKALELALTQIHKQFGEGSVMKLGQEGNLLAVETIPHRRSHSRHRSGRWWGSPRAHHRTLRSGELRQDYPGPPHTGQRTAYGRYRSFH
jgi:hypothetical protein